MAGEEWNEEQLAYLNTLQNITKNQKGVATPAQQAVAVAAVARMAPEDKKEAANQFIENRTKKFKKTKKAQKKATPPKTSLAAAKDILTTHKKHQNNAYSDKPYADDANEQQVKQAKKVVRSHALKKRLPKFIFKGLEKAGVVASVEADQIVPRVSSSTAPTVAMSTDSQASQSTEMPDFTPALKTDTSKIVGESPIKGTQPRWGASKIHETKGNYGRNKEQPEVPVKVEPKKKAKSRAERTQVGRADLTRVGSFTPGELAALSGESTAKVSTGGKRFLTGGSSSKPHAQRNGQSQSIGSKGPGRG